jgi:Xaa-Pro dipeptidase
MQIDYEARRARLRQIAGVDAVAIVPGWNMVYFTGIHAHLNERPFIALVTADDIGFILPRLELLNVTARNDLTAKTFAWTDEDGYEGAFAAALDEMGLRGKTLGIDGFTMRASEMLTFQRHDPTLNIRTIEDDLIAIRAIKSADEIEAMRRACQIAESALAQLISETQIGMTERQLSLRLSALMVEHGGEGDSFAPHVQIGTNSANPHGVSGDRPLSEGEFMLIDFGCRWGGYPSDITRTFCFGEPTPEMQHIYDAVLAANEAGKAAAKPGVPMRVVDQAARQVIVDAGYGDYFTHRTGHGIGLDIHESIPQIASNVETLLQPGMTFTVEPGIYLPQLGGVRIEDNLAITETGADILTSYPRSLRVR